MSEIKLFNKIIKDTINRIKELQHQLIQEELDDNELGHFEDCGSFYNDQVIKTKAIIAELICQKIKYEKWRKKLKYELKEEISEKA